MTFKGYLIGRSLTRCIMNGSDAVGRCWFSNCAYVKFVVFPPRRIRIEPAPTRRFYGICTKFSRLALAATTAIRGTWYDRVGFRQFACKIHARPRRTPASCVVRPRRQPAITLLKRFPDLALGCRPLSFTDLLAPVLAVVSVQLAPSFATFNQL